MCPTGCSHMTSALRSCSIGAKRSLSLGKTSALFPWKNLQGAAAVGGGSGRRGGGGPRERAVVLRRSSLAARTRRGRAAVLRALRWLPGRVMSAGGRREDRLAFAWPRKGPRQRRPAATELKRACGLHGPEISSPSRCKRRRQRVLPRAPSCPACLFVCQRKKARQRARQEWLC